MAYTAIDDPSAHFHIQLYTGDGSANNAITNDANAGDFQPDLVWIKNWEATDSHCIFDSTRGATEVLHCDATTAETTDADTLDSFASDGFQVDADDKVNTDTEAYVAWQWKANGGSTSSNTSGVITSTVQANTEAGFSIVKYTGPNDGNDSANNGGAYWSIGHGLGAAPEAILLKGYEGAHNWYLWTKSMGAETSGYYQRFNADLAATNNANILWGNTAFSSTLFEVGGWDVVNRSPQNYIAYMWTPIQGYSKFGSYTGNGDADGPFVYTGFRPAFFMVKNASTGSTEWRLYDNKQSAYNPADRVIYPSSNAAGSNTGHPVDLDSNGVKIRGTWTEVNTSGDTYVYIAFAESPFVTSGGVPCTAR